MCDLNELAPFGWIIGRPARLTGGRADGREAVEVTVDDIELLVVVSVRAQIARRTVWIARVIHTGPQVAIVEVFVLVIETECVSHFLADDRLTPTWRVVLSLAEVRVIDLHGALRDVAAAGDPDLRDAEPTSAPIGGVANLDASRGRGARRPVRASGHNSGVQYVGVAPVR